MSTSSLSATSIIQSIQFNTILEVARLYLKHFLQSLRVTKVKIIYIISYGYGLINLLKYWEIQIFSSAATLQIYHARRSVVVVG